jgi:leucyl aminopeptidase
MKISVSPKVPKAELVLIALYKGEKLTTAHKSALGSSLTKEAEERMKNKDFEATSGQSLALYAGKTKFVLVGRGEKKDAMPNDAAMLGGSFAAHSKGKKTLAILADENELSELAHGFALGNYEYTKYKKEDKKAVKLTSVSFVCKDSRENKAIANKANIFAEASSMMRDLINAPAGDMDTFDMTKVAQSIAKKNKLKITVHDEKKLQKLGCGALYGVGKGAERGPRMVILEYKYKSKSKVPNIAFIGKGIVFDTGGLNLKPTGYIETMKIDMAGAATVLGTMQAIAEAKMPGNFIGVICCAENAISDRAVRPGDVLTAFNGKTIEVTNTDAEGRLALADGLSYTEKTYKPKMMIDIATLTGAVTVALGYHITGVIGNNEKAVEEVLKTAEENQERMWHLPLSPDFKKATKGSFTDTKNSTNGVRAGATMGAAFLSNFVDKTPWVHLDIGGTAWAEKPSPCTKYGATAVALRTFVAMAEKHSG